MTTAEATPEHLDELAGRADRAFLGHPKGLGYLSAVEWCERFSYYSMQNLLVLYMVNYLLPQRFSEVVGLGWLQQARYDGAEGQVLASAIFGDYSSLVYLTPILGGLVADRWFGRRATLIAGGIVMSLGHFLMAFEGAFLFALVTLIVGVGLFKGNIASQVGALYKDGDLRRAMAFQIFYIAVNLSVIVAPFISGTLGEKVGWHYGFGTAGIVMVIGVMIYFKAGPWLPADNRPDRAAGKAVHNPMTADDWKRVIAVIVLVPVMAISLLTNQQIFNAYVVWGDQHFDLTAFGFRLPTTWLLALDAATSFGMLVAVAAFWSWRAKRAGTEPDELGKMIIGSFFTISGGLCLVIAAATQGDGKIGLFWPFMFHLVNAIGFAHILPVALALFTRLAPQQINATVIGIYYLSFFMANQIVGRMGGWYSTMDTVQFWLLHVASAAVGLLAFALFKLFLARRLMGEAVPA